MEYNAISGNLVLTDGESQKEYQRDNLEFDLYGAYDISEEDNSARKKIRWIQ